MNEEILFYKEYSIKSRDFVHAGEASLDLKNILKNIGFNAVVIRRVAIASYEAELNTVMYGKKGEMSFTLKPDGVYLVFTDQGPGIPDIDLAMKEGYSTATDELREMGFGAGMGLPNIKKNSDEFNIQSQVGKGTKVTIIIKDK
ncbi:MAG: anti-sigma regulatory factor [bacterium]